MELKKRHFLHVINLHRGTIRSLCKIYYPDAEDQKDAFQDVILQLWKSFDSFRGEAEISTWMYRVGLNTLLTKIKKEKKSIRMDPILGSHEWVSVARADDDLELLSMIIQSLKAIDKAIVVLHLEGYRNKEIASILNMSQTNVATRFNRVKAQMKRKINQKTHASKPS